MIRMVDLVFGRSMARAAAGGELLEAPASPPRLRHAEPERPQPGAPQSASESPRPSPVAPGQRHARSARLGADDVAAMVALTGAQGEAGLLEGLLASHLLGCAVALAAKAGPGQSVITLNHRVMCKQPAPVDTDISVMSHVLQARWNHRLKGWVAELEAEATAAGQLLMSSLTTLLLKPLGA